MDLSRSSRNIFNGPSLEKEIERKGRGGIDGDGERIKMPQKRAREVLNNEKNSLTLL